MFQDKSPNEEEVQEVKFLPIYKFYKNVSLLRLDQRLSQDRLHLQATSDLVVRVPQLFYFLVLSINWHS